MKVYLFLGYSVYLLMFFPALVVQQIQRRPAPVAGFSYGSLVTGIWSCFFYFFFYWEIKAHPSLLSPSYSRWFCS